MRVIILARTSNAVVITYIMPNSRPCLRSLSILPRAFHSISFGKIWGGQILGCGMEVGGFFPTCAFRGWAEVRWTMWQTSDRHRNDSQAVIERHGRVSFCWWAVCFGGLRCARLFCIIAVMATCSFYARATITSIM